MATKQKVVSDPKEMSLADQIMNFNIIGALRPKLGTRYIVDSNSNKLKFFESFFSIDFNTPWYYVKNDPKRCCVFYEDCAEHLKFVHPRCLECWKVVVLPRNIVELFEVLRVQKQMVQKDPDCWCKCGIEVRPFVARNYGAYFYNNSKEQGLEKLDWVRQEMSKIDPGIVCFLKRGCTEFELWFGSSDKWTLTDDAKVWLKLIDKFTDINKIGYEQPEIIQKDVMSRWIEFAIDRGDKTVELLNNNKPYYTPYVRYEKE